MLDETNQLPKVTRIDFIQVEGAVIINKFVVTDRNLGPDPMDRIVESTQNRGFDLEGALTWCSSHGWTVHTWPGGARAWKGQPYRVRDARTIQRKRSELRQRLMHGHTDGTTGEYAYDLAYDL